MTNFLAQLLKVLMCGHMVCQTDKLEALKERMIMVRDIFRNKETTEFVIVTIPTVSFLLHYDMFSYVRCRSMLLGSVMSFILA